MERLPMELLILLLERRGELVSRDEIAERLWGNDVFLDVEHGINVAIRKVRAALRDDPEKPLFVETVVGKGYRFAAPVIVNGDATASAATGLSVTQEPTRLSQIVTRAVAPSGQNRRRPSVSKLLASAAAVLAIIASGWFAIDPRRAGSATPPAIKSLAVLPLKNLSGDPAQEYLADGMTEALISRLSGIHSLRVISRTSTMSFKDTKLSLPEIAKTLQVDAVVEGSVIREGNRIRVTAQLIRGSIDQHFWSQTYDRKLPDVFALQSDISQAIARKIEVTLTGKERERLAAAHAIAPEVYESYLKGHFEFYNASTDAGFERSIAYFAEAIKKDPSFAPAYVGLGNAYMQLDTGLTPEKQRAEAVSAARTALQLDPDLADAHLLLADVYEGQWHWAEAETEYRRAIELNPNDGYAHAGLATWLVAQGRTEEALASMRRGRELDPVSVHGTDVGGILLCSRRYDDAIREYRNVLAFKPDALEALSQLGMTLTLKGQPEQAIPLLEKAVSVSARSPDSIASLIVAESHAGRRSDALRLLAELKKRKQSGYVPASAFVTAYIGLGDNEPAFDWLEEAYKERSNLLLLVQVFPLLDPLRGDARFADLVHRVGLSDVSRND